MKKRYVYTLLSFLFVFFVTIYVLHWMKNVPCEKYKNKLIIGVPAKCIKYFVEE